MGIQITAVKPTVFFIEEDKQLWQKAEMTLTAVTGPVKGAVKVIGNGQSRITEFLVAGDGEQAVEIYVPDIAEKTNMECILLDEDRQVLDTFVAEWSPQKHWEVCFVPLAHHDLGYTDPIEELLPLYDTFYDHVLRFCEETADWPEEAQYRYTVETAWSLQHYVENRPKEVVDRFMHFVREGRIEVSALFAHVIDAICGHEQLNRLMYPSFKLKQEYDFTIDTAGIVDIPGLSWAIPSLLAGAGIKYFFAGMPSYFEWEDRQDIHNFWDEKSIIRHGRPDAFRWEGPDGASVLAYYSGGYGWFLGSLPSSVTSPDTFREVMDNLPGFLETMDRNGSPFSVVRYVDHGVDNYQPLMNISHIAREWNKRFAFPKLIVSTNRLFFEKLDQQAADVPVFRGELPHTDYAVCATSAAKETAINRVTHEVLQAAENLSALNSLITKDEYPLEKIRQSYIDTILYDEHCFGMWQPYGKIMDWNWSTKAHYAYRAASRAQSMLMKSARNMTGKIKFTEDAPHITVFNSLSFTRSDAVKLNNFDIGLEPFDLIDVRTGKKIAYQIVELDNPDLPAPYASQRYAIGQVDKDKKGVRLKNFLYTLVFVAEDVPALGYKTFRLIPAADADNAGHVDDAPTATEVEATRIENQFYRVRLDAHTGAIASIFDKEAGRELVDQAAAHQFNQLVIRSVQDGNIATSGAATLARGVTGPVCSSLISSTQGAGCPRLVQEIVLYDRLKKIDIANRLLKDATPFQEIYFAFPFKVDNPEFRFEGTNSVIRPFKDQFPGSNTNHYTVQHWAEVANADTRIVLSPVEAHTLEFGGLWPCYVSHAHHGIDPVDYGRAFVTEEEMTANGHMYSFVINSNYRTNFSPTQCCDVLFRYSITSESSVLPYQFGWGNGNPLLPIYTAGLNPGVLSDHFSFCDVSPDRVFLSAFKQAEDGRGFILRFLETAGQSGTAAVKLSAIKAKNVFLTNIVEENVRPLSTEQNVIQVPVAAYGITTIRIEPEETNESAPWNFFTRLMNNGASFIG